MFDSADTLDSSPRRRNRWDPFNNLCVLSERPAGNLAPHGAQLPRCWRCDAAGRPITTTTVVIITRENGGGREGRRRQTMPRRTRRLILVTLQLDRRAPCRFQRLRAACRALLLLRLDQVLDRSTKRRRSAGRWRFLLLRLDLVLDRSTNRSKSAARSTNRRRSPCPMRMFRLGLALGDCDL